MQPSLPFLMKVKLFVSRQLQQNIALTDRLLKLGWFKKYLAESEVFCMAPWIQINAQTDGRLAPCCMADSTDTRQIGNLNEDADLLAAWNSPKMRQLRLNMLNGKKSAICKHCYKYEQHGNSSERTGYNLHQKHYASRILATDETGFLHEESIPVIDLRFSNKCNYKCRICNSEYSSLWYEEELKIGRLEGGATIKELFFTNQKETLWRSLRQQLPTVKRIHFAGGEPLFMDEHYQTVEQLIELGNTDAILSYNTNFSTLRYKKYDVVAMWQKFKSVDVWASFDGMGAKGDYQRKGQRWERIEANIREVQQQCPHLLFGVNVTVSIFNVLDVTDFYHYMVTNHFVQPERMNLYLLFGPKCFSVTQLPLHLKELVKKRFEDFEQHVLPGIPNSDNFRNHLRSVCQYMFSEAPTLQHTLRERILQVDELREEKFSELFPELAEIVA
jgi:MoaA/NifB/PqqE/SkfB family radical SAM enzyme